MMLIYYLVNMNHMLRSCKFWGMYMYRRSQCTEKYTIVTDIFILNVYRMNVVD